MALEWLKTILGDSYTEDIDKKVSAEIGKGFVSKDDFNTKNIKLKEAEANLAQYQTEIETLKTTNAGAEEYKSKFETLQREITEKEESTKAELADKELTSAITGVFGDKKFTSDYVRNGLISDMKSEISKPENTSKGYAEIFNNLTKDKTGIFASEHPAGQLMSGFGNTNNTEIETNTLRAAMGLAPETTK